MFVAAAVLFGMVAFQRLSINLLPDITYPTLTVRTEYEGTAPSEMERLITEPIEGSCRSSGLAAAKLGEHSKDRMKVSGRSLIERSVPCPGAVHGSGSQGEVSVDSPFSDRTPFCAVKAT